MMVVTSYHQAFLMHLSADTVITQVVAITEDVAAVFGLYNGFLLLHNDGLLSVATVIKETASFNIDRIASSPYRKLRFVGRDDGKRYDFTGYRESNSDSITISYNPFELTITSNQKMLGSTLELSRGIYEVVN